MGVAFNVLLVYHFQSLRLAPYVRTLRGIFGGVCVSKCCCDETPCYRFPKYLSPCAFIVHALVTRSPFPSNIAMYVSWLSSQAPESIILQVDPCVHAPIKLKQLLCSLGAQGAFTFVFFSPCSGSSCFLTFFPDFLASLSCSLMDFSLSLILCSSAATMSIH